MTAPPARGRTTVWSVLIFAASLSATKAERLPLLCTSGSMRLVESVAGPIAPPASDAEFLRRASLDLTGLPPTSDEVRSFLDDADAAKRAKAVDRLLTDPLYARHMALTFDVMLMERRTASAVSDDEWKNISSAPSDRTSRLTFWRRSCFPLTAAIRRRDLPRDSFSIGRSSRTC